MKTSFRIFVLLSMILGLCAASPLQTASAQAGTDDGRTVMPTGLQEAFLSASSRTFSVQGTNYTTEYNGLKYNLNPGGLQAQGSGIQWGIALRGLGRGAQVENVIAPEIVQMNQRLEYRRGGLTEWYRDTALGLEQGFTISTAPKGNGRLVLHLDLSTNVKGKLNADQRGISFAGADGQTLRYDQLKAFDANGVELNTKMSYHPAQIVIQVDDRNAAYPITIDPFIYLEQKVIAVDGAMENYFGESVALSNDTALVGASAYSACQGAVYVFTLVGTTWSYQATLTASDGAADDHFGGSVAISGDTALISASWDDIDVNSGQGSAYIFVRSGTTWAQQQKLTASDGESGDSFGSSVALSGNTALVGAPEDTVNTRDDQGSAYIFVRNGTVWTQQQQLTYEDGNHYNYFGYSVALSNDTALIGEPAGGHSTKAHIFGWNGTAWEHQATLTPSATDPTNFFGSAVALSGDAALIGAPYVNDQGAAYIFAKPETGWTDMHETAELSPADLAVGDRFGASVAISGNTVIVGSDEANGKQGVVYYFVNDGATWIQLYHQSSSDGAVDDYYGNSVALFGGTALVGAFRDDVGGNIDQGSAYFFDAYRYNSDLAVSMASGTGNTLYDDGTAYLTVKVTNYGPSSANNVLLKVNLPAGLTFISNAATHGTFNSSVGSWNVGDLPFGVAATLTIKARVEFITSPTQTLTATAESLARDPNNSNNSSSLTLTIKKKEMVHNGGFNSYIGTSKIPNQWTATNFASTDGKDTTAANRKEGTASLKVGGQTSKIKTLSQTLSSLSGSTGDPFTLSYWVKGNSIPTTAGYCKVEVFFYNGHVSTGTKKLDCGSTGTFAYTKKTLSFTAPGAYDELVIKITYSKGSGTVWFDLLSLLR